MGTGSETSDGGSDSAAVDTSVSVSNEPDRTDVNDEPSDVTEEESTTENYVITISIDGKDHDGNATTAAVMEQYDE